MSQVPLQRTNATFFSAAPADTPRIAAIFSPTGAPPTGHAFAGALPSAIAFANASQPAKPQPPQLFPGSSSRIATSFSSTSTLNFSPKSPRPIPTMIPATAITAAAIKIAVMFIFVSSFYSNPENPKNAIAIRPAVTSTIGDPWKLYGISFPSIRSRIPARSTMETV